MLDTSPKTSIFGDLRVKADQLSHGGDMAGQLTCLKLKAIYHISKAMCFLKVKVDHLTTLAPDTVSSILVSPLLEATSNSCQPYSGLLYFKIYTKSKKKMCWKSRGTVTSLGTGKKYFTYLLRLAITHDCP